jgi:type VI secretion system (T6SS) effector TldE1-like protein
MTSVRTTADRLSLHRGFSRSETAALTLAAVALALGAAAWISDSANTAILPTAALPANAGLSSFADRFQPAARPESLAGNFASQALDRSALSAAEIKLREAKGLLAQQLQTQGWRSALLEDGPKVDESRPAAPSGIPLPRSRPVEANLETRAGAALALVENAPQPDRRTLLQKLSDLIPGRVRLASLSPDGGLFRDGPDLGALGYDGQTAVYDISAHAVFMPNGSKLEAHSGMGSLMDDPEHVHEVNIGATPPAVYDLKPRERLFHGVRALRMIPVDSNATLGRSGLLAHSYMLGPNGDSNGCVSFKNYDRFLQAYSNGEVTRLVVVPSLGDAASRRSTSQS